MIAHRVEGLTLKKRVLVSTAAPTRGALIPLYMPMNPSRCSDCLKQSNGPLYRRGRVAGCDCRRTLTVSKGYSMYLPTMPATEPQTTSFNASSPCPLVFATAAGRASSTMTGLLNPPLAPTTDTGFLCNSMRVLVLSVRVFVVFVRSVAINASSSSGEHGTLYRAAIVGGEEGERCLLKLLDA